MKLSFLFIGPQRTGTTWLYKHLIKHPNLCFPKDVKETMFFDRNFEKGMKWYEWHFSDCISGQKFGEVAPTFFDSPEVPARVKEIFPNCKIIVSLRNPVDRAQSLYRHHYQKGRVNGTFTEAIERMPRILTSGYYKNHISHWLEYFNEDQLFVISLEKIKDNPQAVLDEIYSFLNIKNVPVQIKEDKINKSLQPRFSWLARIGSGLTTYMHTHRLHFIVNFAKKTGFKRIFFKETANKPVITGNEKDFLKEQFSPHIKYVNENFGDILPLNE